jgi:uncharacterized protein YegP (UPF0339 family)
MARIVVYQDEAGEWRWRKLGGTQIVADSGEGYASKQGAVKAAEAEAGLNDSVEVDEPDEG